MKSSANLKKQNGNKEFGKKNFAEARSLYDEAIALDPDNALLYSNRAAVDIELKEWSDALKDCENCLARDRTLAKAHYRKALALEGLSTSFSPSTLCRRLNELQP
jgi:tetratricopeptide (TPR) repeat protein